MRHTSARLMLVAVALLAGLAWLTRAGAVEPTDDELKALVTQDVQVITKAAEAVEKAPSPKDRKVVARNAGSGIKSSAVLLATYANAKITGKDPAADGKAAAVRDAAIKIYKAAADGDYKAAATEAAGLATAKPAAKAGKIDLAKAFGELTSKDVMHNFLKTTQYGTNAEADIKANAKKASAKPADTALMMHRVLAMYELNKVAINAEGAAQRKEWEEYNERMHKASMALLEAGRKKTSAADLAKLFTNLDSTCTACHDSFK